MQAFFDKGLLDKYRNADGVLKTFSVFTKKVEEN